LEEVELEADDDTDNRWMDPAREVSGHSSSSSEVCQPGAFMARC
jgi:hypothetical protein